MSLSSTLLRALSSALLLTSAFAQTTFTNSAAITCAIGAGGAAGNPGTACASYPSNLTVSAMAGTISNVQVRLNNISVERQQDLTAVLVGPNGSNLVFMSDIGDPSTTNTTGVTLTFSDAAASIMAQGVGLFVTGSYKPSGHNTGLAANKDNFPAPAPAQVNLVYPTPFGSATLGGQFNGINPNGTWSLYVMDDALGPASGGTQGINIAGGWSLIVTTAVAAAPTGTTVSSSLNPSLTGNGVTFTATVTSAGNPVTLGTVQFFEGITALSGAIALNGAGQAAFTTSSLTEGNHTIRADYSGATGFGSSSGTVNQEVNNATQVSGATFCNTGALTVVNDVNSPSATPYPSKIFVTGLGGTVSSMTLDVKGLTGGRADDFEMLLVGPNTNKFVFLNDVGGFNPVAGVNLTLSDGAANPLLDDTVFASGTFRPTAVNSSAANFPAPAPASPYNFAAPFGASTFGANYNGASPNGTWQLFFVDDSAGGTQSSIANGWCVSFVTTNDPATTTTVTSSQNPSFTTAPNNSVTFTATVRNASTSALVTVGSVTFLEGSTVLAGPTALSGVGTASFTTTSLTEGVHVITAAYSGSPGQFNLSQGTFSQTVDNHTVVTGNQFCNPGPLGVPTSGLAIQYPARIFVSGLSGQLSKMTMTLRNMNGVRPDDLDLLLVGPTGAKFVPLSDAGGPVDAVGITLTLDDAAGSLVPDNGPLSTGSFQPSSVTPAGQGVDPFPSPAPAGPHNEAAPAGSATFTSTFQGTDPNGTWQIFVNDDQLGGPGSFTNGVCLDFTLAPDLRITKTHSGNFAQGQVGAQYSIVVDNVSNAPAAGTITVTDTLPAGLTKTAITGSGWTCVLSTLSCSRSDGLAGGSAFPPIAVTVDVSASAAASVINSATVTAPTAGELNLANNTANDTTTVDAAVAVTVNTNPAGRSFSVNGNPFSSAQTFNFTVGSNVLLATTSPQAGAAGTQYVFANWSDMGAISHSITVPPGPITITGTFTTQFQLTTAAGTGGTVTPATGSFFDSGTVVNVTATPNAGFVFSSWTGPVANAAAASTTVTMDAAKSIAAVFSAVVGAPDVTAQLTITRGVLAFNRGTGRYSQTVTIINNGAALTASAYVVDSLAAGYAMFAPSGFTALTSPAGSPYKEIGAIGAGANVTFTVEFTRVGTPALTYTPRALGAGSR